MRGNRELSCFERDETTSWMFLEKKKQGPMEQDIPLAPGV